MVVDVQTEATLSDRYQIRSEIAAGGMATVYLALDLVLKREVAVKILSPRLAADPDLLERFRREAVSAAALNHPNIASVFDTGDQEGLPFIVMELIRGPSLRKLLDDETSFDAQRVASMGSACAEALAYAHEAGVIHRDVKPANILFTESSSPKLVDFGIAKAAFVGGDLTATGNILGTVRYLAPEQIEGEEPGPGADIYSLGVVLYEAATGRLPYQGATDLSTAMARLESDPPPPRDINPAIPRELEAVIMRALRRRPEDRFPGAGEMAQALGPSAPKPSSPRAVPRKTTPAGGATFLRSEGRWLAIVVLVVALAAGLVLGIQQLSKEGRPLEALGGLLRPGTAGEPLRFDSVGVFDPADGQEQNHRLPLLHDGNPETAWSTLWYANPEFGGLQDGVGVFVVFPEPTQVSEIEVLSRTEDWTASIRRSDDGADWGPPQSQADLGPPGHTFEVTGTHRYWMVWITRLGRTPGLGEAGIPYSAEIAEIVAR